MKAKNTDFYKAIQGKSENHLDKEAYKMYEELEKLRKDSAELMSLRMSIIESPLNNFFPKKEGISFHDKVVFAIHEACESRNDNFNSDDLWVKVMVEAQYIDSEGIWKVIQGLRDKGFQLSLNPASKEIGLINVI